MTVSSTTISRKEYNGNGSTTNFPITFPYAAEADVVVIHVDASGVETTWVNGGAGATGYTIVSDEIVANTAPATGEQLVIYRETDKTQEVDIPNNQRLPGPTEEAALDKLTLIVQELEEALTRCVQNSIVEGEVTLTAVNIITVEINAAAAAASAAKAEDWAEEVEDTEVETGQYSAKHWTAKAEDWAAKAEEWAEEWAAKAEKWAEEVEDTEVETGKYSAKHWAAKAEEITTLSILTGNLNCDDLEISKPLFKDSAETTQALGSLSSNTTINLQSGNVAVCTIADDLTFTFSNPPATGKTGILMIEMTNAGAHTITWPGAVAWDGGLEPGWQTSGVDIASFITRDAGTTWRGVRTWGSA